MVRVIVKTVEITAYPIEEAGPAALTDMREIQFNHS